MSPNPVASTRRTRRTAVIALTGLALLLGIALPPGGPLAGTTSGLLAPSAEPAAIDPALQALVAPGQNADTEALGAPASREAADGASGATGTDTTESGATEPGATESDGAEPDAPEDWVDPDTGAAEILVLFDDSGVPAAAEGSPELAADALASQADAQWDAAERGLTALEREHDVEVLNRFWVTSAVLVSAVPSEPVLAALAALPGARDVVPNYTVEGLAEDPPVELESPSIPAEAYTVDPAAAEAAAEVVADPDAPITYGLERINADDAWRDFGAAGAGVRVAVLDTGVDATHPDIASHLVGRGTGDPSFPGGWINFDRTGKPVVSTPTDPGSHGTHVAGTILGGDASGTQIGVAPEAELMAANVLSGGGSSAKIFSALQWVLAPYDGTGKPAGRAADVINMSLGSGAYDASLIQPIRNLREAGVFPAIAIGNAPCGPNGTSSPGDIYEAFGVGMTNSADEVDPGSCGAVTHWPAATAEQYGWPTAFAKPDASAPGAKVFSAIPGGRWGESTGTSMATPHVAGAVALIRSAQAGLSVDEIATALESTAWHPNPDATEPDTRYGAGRIDVHAAIAAVRGEAGVAGRILDAATGLPVSGATVSYGAHGETWTTDATGRFTARLVPGEYTLTVERFGYTSAQSGVLTVTAGVFQTLELPLTQITVGALRGVVVDHATDAPLPGATVAVVGQTISTVTAADGSYEIPGLPIGAYQLRATADGTQESISAAAPVRAALTTTVNFRLAKMQRVLVLGDNGDRTSTLLSENGLLAESARALPADPAALAAYDAVLWDTPEAATAEQLTAAIAATDAAGTGVIWLDLGADEQSGIATLHRLQGDPATRGAANDRTLSATGYRITQPHEIFAGGMLSPDSLQPGSVLRQNTASGGPKFTAWFEELTGVQPTVLAEAVVLRDAEGSGTVVEPLGSGIAVDQRATNRHLFLSLHGSSTAVDARSWSLASAQVLLNGITWAAPAAVQAPAPEIILPVPPVVPPDGGTNPRPQKPPVSTPAEPAVQLPAASPSATSAAGSRAPSTQSVPKPEFVPDPPVASSDLLTSENAGGVTARVENGIAYVTIPDAKPGDWFFLHVYPTKTAVDWIRVNDDGELRIDVARIPGGEYRFAFTAADSSFAGWVAVRIPGAAERAAEAAQLTTVVEDVDAATTAGIAGFRLSPAEQLMLLGAALILLAAAGVTLLGTRRPAAGLPGTAGVPVAAPGTSAPGAPPPGRAASGSAPQGPVS
ncbi:S8 family serine peptidase [Leucobacter rhizosphaerae]|uniref:S8 family serine peptidase n=1 Tax=Leucobacter rhizosphaerae TaxID=2932245 RepID=A0ABY4FUA4_9MICO|nr:S8 family serine peptidase [Leucobacter rhizosphaerae]UOQ59878.1 S8 family serine peptidase [Leucobacter rhizosphaerae]